MKLINKMLEACISSAMAEPIKLVEKHKTKMIRSQLHCMLLMPFGGGKSTMIKEQIPEKLKFELKDYKLPGIAGTITRDGELVKGAIISAAGKCLVIDEGHNLSLSGRDAMNSLLEGEPYSRGLGFNLKKPVRSKGNFYEVRAKEGVMSVKAKFSCLLCGIYARKDHINDLAFLSRFVPLNILITPAEGFEQLRGKETFEIKPKPYVETPIFEDYLKFVDAYENSYNIFMRKSSKSLNLMLRKIGFAKRSIGDFSRFFSYLNQGNSVIEDWEKWIPYIPVCLYNYFASSLTLTEFEVLNLINEGINQKKTAKMLNISETYVSLVLKKLRGLNLVKFI